MPGSVCGCKRHTTAIPFPSQHHRLPAPSPADFQERLRFYSLRKQLKQAAAAAAAGAEACTFRPDTGNAVQVLALSAARAGQVLETEQVGRACRNPLHLCGCGHVLGLAAGGSQQASGSMHACGQCQQASADRERPTTMAGRLYWLRDVRALVLHPAQPPHDCPTFPHPQERYERLAGEEAARLAAKRAAKEAEVYGSLDFKPQLNPRSLALAPAGSGGVGALASGDRQRRKLAELRAEEEARQRAECTFQVGRWGPH